MKVYYEENNVHLQGNATKNIFILAAILDFLEKAEPILERLTTKFHYLKLCTKLGAFVRPINIKLKNDVNLGTNKYPFGYGQKTLNMTHFEIFYFVLILSIFLNKDIRLIHIRIKRYH